MSNTCQCSDIKEAMDAAALERAKQCEEVGCLRAELERVKAKYMAQLSAPHQLGNLSHENLRNRIAYRLDPCLAALSILEFTTAKEILAEVKNVAGFKDRTEQRPACGIPDCTCHLRILNAFLAPWQDEWLRDMELQIVAAEDARHAARDVFVAAMRALDDATFAKRIADENLEEAKWEGGVILMSDWNDEMRMLNATLTEATAVELVAREAYDAASRAMGVPATEFYRLVALKKQKIEHHQ